MQTIHRPRGFYRFLVEYKKKKIGWCLLMSKNVYGGQAVIEGVMFAGRHHSVTAIRRKDGSIEYFHVPRETNKTLASFKKFRFFAAFLLLFKQAQTDRNIYNFQANDMTSIQPKMKRCKLNLRPNGR